MQKFTWTFLKNNSWSQTIFIMISQYFIIDTLINQKVEE